MKKAVRLFPFKSVLCHSRFHEIEKTFATTCCLYCTSDSRGAARIDCLAAIHPHSGGDNNGNLSLKDVFEVEELCTFPCLIKRCCTRLYTTHTNSYFMLTWGSLAGMKPEIYYPSCSSLLLYIS